MPETATGYCMVRGQSREVDDFEMGQALVKAANMQKAIKVSQRAAQAAKDKGNWEVFAYHLFYCGRLCQGLHFLKRKHDLDVEIPDPAYPDVPSFISQATRDNFPEISV